MGGASRVSRGMVGGSGSEGEGEGEGGQCSFREGGRERREEERRGEESGVGHCVGMMQILWIAHQLGGLVS